MSAEYKPSTTAAQLLPGLRLLALETDKLNAARGPDDPERQIVTCNTIHDKT
ncbi:hypothetical protein ACIQU3_36340 [Streptomyces sp. NPDC101110]|uniref:hypothetical protein n=1 Tax=unclassified Streptomyces TaxID=2593676 RepID=UPI00381506D9